MTPQDIHYGLATAKWQRRAQILRAAYEAHPERFPRGVPVPPAAADGGLDQQALDGAGARRARGELQPRPPDLIMLRNAVDLCSP